ncbi:hypothetical protein [Amycolatopsis taiwanensis]|uniref:hypothetical protein n=1 Tax=Amycolatopsis taiwanensis TaxID=342230 RepID=UPI0012EB0F3E|nr:hypothetical protein [Amycolatopsis taiwanensis]
MRRRQDEGEPATVNTVADSVIGAVVQAGSISGGVHVHQHLRPAARPSRARRLAERPPWLARVPQLGGAGMLVDEWHVVTALPADGDVGDVVVEFPFADEQPARRGRVVERVSDAAVLRLAEPVAVTPAPLACPPSLHDHRFWVHGFPSNGPEIRQGHGTLGGACGPDGRWVRLMGHDAADGFTGAPVFDHDSDAVVGIVVSGEAVLPVSRWPWLAAQVRWRLDLDPGLTTHWLPRARGSEIESDSGTWYFTGRHAARAAVVDWLRNPDQPALVVIGGPGTGKSALLAHLLVGSDPVLHAGVPVDGPRPPVRSFDVAVHATGLGCDNVVTRLASACQVDAATPQELLVAVRERLRSGLPPLTVLVDAVEEAADVDEARQIAVLLRNLAGTGAVRVLAGVRTAPAGSARARVPAAFGRTARYLDLESHRFMRNRDVVDYVSRRLIGEETGSVRYRDRPPGELRAIAWAVARKARYNFLIAQLVTRWLVHPSTPPLDLDDSAWEHHLPETVGQAMDAYLDTCGPDAALVRRLLTALAFARGEGLSRGRTWLVIADALHPAYPHTPPELETVFNGAANYLIERADNSDGQPCYRLYHNALDEHLREQCAVRDPHSAVVTALADAVPRNGSRAEWAKADSYTRAHLAGHAAQAGRLDGLLADMGFLLHAEPGPMLAALSHVSTKDGRLTALAYRMSSHHHRDTGPGVRRRFLALDAARLNATDLLRRIDTVADEIPEGGLDWRVSFATGYTLPTAAIVTFTGHTGPVNAVAVGELDDRPVAVSGSEDGTVRVWDLAEHGQIGQPMAGHDGWVRAVAVTELDGRPIAVTGGSDNAVNVWDLVEQHRIGTTLRASADILGVVAAELGGSPVAVTYDFEWSARVWDIGEQRQLWHLGENSHKCVAVTDVAGRCIVLTGDSTGMRGPKRVRLWDLETRREVDHLATGHSNYLNALSTGDLNGRPGAVIVDENNTMQVWDLAERRLIGRRDIETAHGIQSAAMTTVDGRAVVVTGGRDGAVRLWDAATQQQIGAPLTGHTGEIEGLTVTRLDGRPVAVTASRDATVRVWDLAEQDRPARPVTGHTGDVTAVSVTALDGRPVAVTVGEDATVRLWDLMGRHQIGEPMTGHTDEIATLAVAELNGRPVAVTAGGGNERDSTVRMWDLAGQRQIGTPMTGHAVYVMASAAFELDGRPVAVTGSGDRTVRFWDLIEQREVREPITGHTDRVSAVTVAEWHGRPAVITGCDDRVRIWDLAEQRYVREVVVGRTREGDVPALAVTRLDGRLIAVTGGEERIIRLWDLAEQCQVGPSMTGHTDEVTAVAVVEVDGRPVVMSGSQDATVRVWDARSGDCLDDFAMPAPVGCLAHGYETVVVGFGCDIAVFDVARFRLR